MTRLLGRRVRAMVAAVLLGASLGTALATGAAGATTAEMTPAAWRAAMPTVAVPASGCFSSAYPRLSWAQVPCQPAPAIRLIPRPKAARAGERVGDGYDYSAKVLSGSISTATGSFPYVSPGASEIGEQGGAGTPVANAFSLQLNSEYFSGSPACAGAANPSACLGWQQFAYASTPTFDDRPTVFMEYWLLTYDATCPAGWITYGTTCVQNSKATYLTALLAVTDLETISLTGTVHAGGKDSVVVEYDGDRASAVGADTVVGLAGHWTTAEFGIFGDGTGSSATFSQGTILDVKTTVNNGAAAAPSCDLVGFTGETNNLSFGGAPSISPGPVPAIETRQASTGGTPGCAASGAASAPGKPDRPKAAPGKERATVSWPRDTMTRGASITGYTVTSSPGAKTCSPATLAAPSCTVTGLTDGTLYTFSVTAHNSVGTSKPSKSSSPVTPEVMAPARPAAPSVTAGNASVAATWTKPTTEGSTIKSYVVTSTTGAHSCSTKGALTCTVKGLTNGHRYKFSLVAHNAGGPSTPSPYSKAVTPEP